MTARTFIGFLAGMATALLVMGIAYQAGKHRSESQPSDSPAALDIPTAAPTHDAHPAATALPAAAARERADLEKRLVAKPDDLVSRKRLAVLLVSHEQYMEAFEHSQTILEHVADDADGLYVEAVVRLRMGQLETAGSLIDRVLQRYPQHQAAQGVRQQIDLRQQDPHAGLQSFQGSTTKQ